MNGQAFDDFGLIVILVLAVVMPLVGIWDFRRLVRRLDTKRYAELVRAWRLFLEETASAGETEESSAYPNASRPIETLASERIRVEQTAGNGEASGPLGAECESVDELTLEGGEEALAECVVVAITDRAH